MTWETFVLQVANDEGIGHGGLDAVFASLSLQKLPLGFSLRLIGAKGAEDNSTCGEHGMLRQCRYKEVR